MELDWSELTEIDNLSWLVPGLIVAVSIIVIGRRVLRDRNAYPESTRRATAAFLAFYWLPVIAVGLFTISPKERYLLHVHLLGYVCVAMVLLWLIRQYGQSKRPPRWQNDLAGLAADGLSTL